MSPDRYYVKEHSGYNINPGAQQAGNALLQTEVLVLDRAYCHNVAWTNHGKHGTGSGLGLHAARQEAARLSAKWNAEDAAL